MDPVTFLLVTYIGSLFLSRKVRAASAGVVKLAGRGARAAVTRGAAPGTGGTGKAHPKGTRPGTPKGRRPGTPKKRARGTRKTLGPSFVSGTQGYASGKVPPPKPRNTRGTPRARTPGTPATPTRPPFGVPVRTTRTTVTVRTETPGAPPMSTPTAGTSQPTNGITKAGAEKIPAHMDASDQAANALEKVVTKYREFAKRVDAGESGKDELRAVITNASAAEKLHITQQPLASHKDAASAAHHALAAIARVGEAAQAAAEAVAAVEEKAKGAARTERAALTPVVEAVRSAPVGDPAHAGSMRG